MVSWKFLKMQNKKLIKMHTKSLSAIRYNWIYFACIGPHFPDVKMFNHILNFFHLLFALFRLNFVHYTLFTFFKIR